MIEKKFYFNDKKFYIRTLKLKDINLNYLNWFKNKENTKFIVNSKFKNLHDLKNYFISQKKRTNFFFGIFENKGDRHIGNIKFEEINLLEKSAYVGILIGDTNYQNKNIGSQCLSKACDIIYQKLNLFKIYLGVNKKNYKAVGSYENSGFYVYKKRRDQYIMLRNYFYSKIIIGTANFQNKYGIVGKNKILTKEKKKIFNLTKKYNLSYYDIAEGYNLNYKLIDKLTTKNSKFYFKLSNGLQNFRFKNLLKFNNYLKKKTILFMIHNLDKIFETGKKINIKNLKNLSKINPLGVSLYNPSEIYKVYKYLRFKFIQVPINIFDQRFLNLKVLKFLKKNNIELIARSIYLQGTLFQNKKFIRKNFLEYNNSFSSLYEKKFKDLRYKKRIINHFIFQNKNIHKVVVGFENSNQLKELIHILDKFYNIKNIKFRKFKVNEIKLINPTYWTKRII